MGEINFCFIVLPGSQWAAQQFIIQTFTFQYYRIQA
jgi:hypothetical protein